MAKVQSIKKTKKPKVDKRKWLRYTFHVNLSDAHEGEEYWLHASGKRHDLQRHTQKTLQQLRAKAPHLAEVPDDRLTHYTTEHVLLPHDQVMRIHIKHSLKTLDDMRGDSAAYHAYMHIPPKKYRPKKGYGMSATDNDAVPVPDGADPPAPFHGQIDWVGTAKALIFHHGDLYTHDPDTAEIIFDYMEQDQSATIYSLISNPTIGPDGLPMGLADRMEHYGPPAASSGWALQVEETVYDRETDANGDYIFDEDGNFVYSTTDYTVHHKQVPIQEIVDYAGTVMTKMMIATKNDAQLEDLKWTQESGTSVDSSDTVTLQNGSASPNLLAKVTLQGDNWTPKLSKTGVHYGLESKLTVHNADKQQVQINVENSFIRYLGMYISFFDADGQRMNLSSVTLDGQPHQKWFPNTSDWSFEKSTIGSDLGWEYDDVRYVTYVSPVNTIMAAPTGPNGETTMYITFPLDAVKAEIYGFGLGTGANTYPNACIIGGTMTGICNLAIPSFLLGFAVAAQSYKPLYDALGNKKVIAGMVTVGATYFSTEFGMAAANKKMDWSAFSSLTEILFTQGCSQALNWCEKQIVEGQLEDEIPFAGWLMIAINIATTLAQMAETIVEVASSPWSIENSISATITSSVTLHPDPRHGAWPEAPAGTQSTCVAKLIYQGQDVPVVSNPVQLAANFTDPTIGFQFPGNTLGGEVKFEVDFYIDDWLAGRALTTFMPNDETHAAAVTLYLVEIPKPLTADTVFNHASILTYQNDQFAWMDTAKAPTSTILNANNSNSGNAISQWVGLALSQRFGTLGMSWKSYGTGLVDATSGAGNTQLFAFQNIDIPGKEMSDVKLTSYGFTGQSMLVYDVYPPEFLMQDGEWVLVNNQPVADPNSVSLGDYYLDPRKASNSQEADGGYHLRKVEVTGSAPFDPNASPLYSYGRFPYFPDHISIHPSGHVIGISQKYCKVMILKLSSTGAADDALPLARDFAGTALESKRKGLLFRPLAVSCSYDGTILILDSIKEQGFAHTRIQAFDLLGRPVNAFHDDNGAPSPFLELPTAVTYLDMVALGNKKMTYMFLLYYAGAGSAVSDYHVAVYQYGETPPASNPLLIADSISAARIQVDMWHTMYTLNYEMTTDGNGNPSGPKGTGVGPSGATVPSVSAWVPDVPT